LSTGNKARTRQDLRIAYSTSNKPGVPIQTDHQLNPRPKAELGWFKKQTFNNQVKADAEGGRALNAGLEPKNKDRQWKRQIKRLCATLGCSFVMKN
jgi:hypothetical protein